MLDESLCQVSQNNEFLPSHSVRCQYSSFDKKAEKNSHFDSDALP